MTYIPNFYALFLQLAFINALFNSYLCCSSLSLSLLLYHHPLLHFRRPFLFSTFIIFSTIFIFINTKHLYIAIYLVLFILNNVKSYVTFYLYSGLMMTYFDRCKLKTESCKPSVFFIFTFFLLYFQYEVEIFFHV